MKDTFKHNTSVDPAELVRYLTALAEGVEAGSLSLMENRHSFSIHPRGFIDLTVNVNRKNGRTRLGLDLSWAEEEADWPLLDEPKSEDL